MGHSTMLLDFGLYRVITDPLLTRRVAHLRRRRPLPSPDVYDVDLVLLSHAHMDHLHLPSLRRLKAGAQVIAPRGAGRLLGREDFDDVVEVGEGDQLVSGPLTVEVVPAAHKSGRGPHSSVEADPVGFVLDTGVNRVYFAGDTDLFAEMADLGTIDVALIPIWGWGPNIGSGHLDPVRAVQAIRLIQPRVVIPMHWGTYAPEDGRRRLPPWFDQAIGRFVTELESAGEGHRLGLLQPGESLTP